MPSLVIPESGLSIGSSRNAPSSKAGPVQDVFGLTLNDSVIEEMIRCVQNGKPIQLSMGEHPSLQYGSKTQHLSASEDQFTHELYRTSYSDSDSESTTMSSHPRNPRMTQIQHVRNTQFDAMFAPKGFFLPKKNLPSSALKSSSASTSVASATAGADAALAALQSSLASENQKKKENTINYVKDGAGLPAPGRRGGPAPRVTNKTKFLSQNRSLGNDTTRSMPSSPALSGVGSPSFGPTSVPLSQQQAEQKKAARKPVIALLAVKPMKEEALQASIPDASNNGIKQALLKVADKNTDGKWELRKMGWKELDVWAHKYESAEDRQRAIDNAVRQYDKMRLGVSEPEWDKLLPKAERGTGKCLSKLQAQIAQGPVARAPKINVHGAEDSGRDTPARKDDDEDAFGDKQLSKAKAGESIARSVSQPPTTKPKKVSEKEAQAMRLSSKNKPAPKPSPVRKEKPKPTSKFLSSQFVDSSDEEDDYLVPGKPAAQSAKRSREDDGETSDSSIPLSKKVKKDNHHHRVSDSSQNSRTTNTSTYSSSSSKTKVHSPQKSSPLASSPPTNASEFENSTGGRTSSSASPAHPTIKIMSSLASRSPIHKRHQKSSSVTSSSSSSSQRHLKQEVMETARKYRTFYPRYLALHREVEALAPRRNVEKEQDLMAMYERLAKMKKDIFEGIIDVA